MYCVCLWASASHPASILHLFAGCLHAAERLTSRGNRKEISDAPEAVGRLATRSRMAADTQTDQPLTTPCHSGMRQLRSPVNLTPLCPTRVDPEIGTELQPAVPTRAKRRGLTRPRPAPGPVRPCASHGRELWTGSSPAIGLVPSARPRQQKESQSADRGSGPRPRGHRGPQEAATMESASPHAGQQVRAGGFQCRLSLQ